MNLSDLLLNTNALPTPTGPLAHSQPSHPPTPIRDTNTIISHNGRPLPAGNFLFAEDSLAGDGVEDVRALGSETFEVGGYVRGAEVCGGESSVGLLALGEPGWVEEFDCECTKEGRG